MIVKGTKADLLKHSIELLPKKSQDEGMKMFAVAELSDGTAYAQGRAEWFEGFTEVKSIPSHCSNCKTLTPKNDLVDDWCQTCCLT